MSTPDLTEAERATLVEQNFAAEACRAEGGSRNLGYVAVWDLLAVAGQPVEVNALVWRAVEAYRDGSESAARSTPGAPTPPGLVQQAIASARLDGVPAEAFDDLTRRLLACVASGSLTGDDAATIQVALAARPLLSSPPVQERTELDGPLVIVRVGPVDSGYFVGPFTPQQAVEWREANVTHPDQQWAVVPLLPDAAVPVTSRFAPLSSPGEFPTGGTS